MDSCEKCGSKKIEKTSENLTEEHLDNVINTYKCQECNYEKSDVVHIG